jgi:hypothetical protein
MKRMPIGNRLNPKGYYNDKGSNHYTDMMGAPRCKKCGVTIIQHECACKKKHKIRGYAF